MKIVDGMYVYQLVLGAIFKPGEDIYEMKDAVCCGKISIFILSTSFTSDPHSLCPPLLVSSVPEKEKVHTALV